MNIKPASGTRGVFYSLITLMQKVASSIAIPLVGVMLQLTHYLANATEQPQSAVWDSNVGWADPGILLTVGIIFAIKYPLGREQFTSIVEELQVRREKA
jgi:Na+/melibiose symporter-like transporter